MIALGIRDLQSGDERLLRPRLREFSRPRWSPDGRHVAVRGRIRTDITACLLIDPETGGAAPVKVFLQAGGHAPRLPVGAGRWLVVRVQDTVASISPPRRAAPSRRAPEAPAGFDVSPRTAQSHLGQPRDVGCPRIARRYHTRFACLRAGRRAAPASAGEFVRDLTWAPDGRSLLFTRTPTGLFAQRRGQLARRVASDATTGEARPLGLRMDRLRDLAVSPDGRRIAFTTGAPLRYPWIVENYLPRLLGGGRCSAQEMCACDAPRTWFILTALACGAPTASQMAQRSTIEGVILDPDGAGSSTRKSPCPAARAGPSENGDNRRCGPLRIPGPAAWHLRGRGYRARVPVARDGPTSRYRSRRRIPSPCSCRSPV